MGQRIGTFSDPLSPSIPEVVLGARVATKLAQLEDLLIKLGLPRPAFAIEAWLSGRGPYHDFVGNIIAGAILGMHQLLLQGGVDEQQARSFELRALAAFGHGPAMAVAWARV